VAHKIVRLGKNNQVREVIAEYTTANEIDSKQVEANYHFIVECVNKEGE
jgi:hypothetical protein